jgi:hypothetical protein
MYDARAGAFAVIPGRHTKQLAQCDLGLARIVERERLWQIFFGEHFRVEAIGNLVARLLEHDAAGDARISLARGRHVGIRVPMRAAKILFEHQIPMSHDQQSAILTATLREIKCLLSLRIHAGQFPDLRGLFQ